MPIRRLRWFIVALFFLATAISYIDRQTLAVVAPVLRDEFGLSNFAYARMLFAFLVAYTVMQPVTGWLVDWLGTRRGFALIMGWWSAAAMLHAAGRGVASFSVFRLLLGAGEAGSWAACVRGVSELFPKQERGFANGVWGAGTSTGMIVSVPLVVWITSAFGWRAAFMATGSIGFAWLVLWLLLYRLPDNQAAIALAEYEHLQGKPPEPGPEPAVSYRTMLLSRAVWGLVLARFFADPIAWFYNAWVPEYLTRSAGFSIGDIGRYGWIPFAAQLLGILLGGALSDRLCGRGWLVINARMAVMLTGVVIMTTGVLAAFRLHVALSLAAISLAIFGFGLWAPNMMSLCSDAFPSHLAGSVTGLTGIGAGFGGMIYTLYTGWTIDHFGYRPVFLTASIFPLAAFGVLYGLFGREQAAQCHTSRS